jgi:hypothetical protein
MELFEPFGAIALDSRNMDQLAVESGDQCEGSLAQLPRISCDGFKHRLHNINPALILLKRLNKPC